MATPEEVIKAKVMDAWNDPQVEHQVLGYTIRRVFIGSRGHRISLSKDDEEELYLPEDAIQILSNKYIATRF